MMIGPILLVLAKCDGTFECHHFDGEHELIFVILNYKKVGEMHLLIELQGKNPFVARRWAKNGLREAMKRKGLWK